MDLPTNSHVVIFPFMAHSHTLPMIDLAKGFSLQQIRVTILTIPSNFKHISPKIQGFPLISIVELNFPNNLDGLSQVNHCENLSLIPSMQFFTSFLTTTTHLHDAFQHFLQSMADSGNLPLCVVSDHFLGWTLEICRQFNVPRLVFHAVGIVPLLINKTIMANSDYLAVSSSHLSDVVHRLLPNLPFDYTPDVPNLDLPSDVNTNPFVQFLAKAEDADLKSWGVFSNTFLELEADHKSALELFYVNRAKVWCLGPSFLYGRHTNANKITNDEHVSLMKWLDARAAEAGRVIYAAFGSLATVTEEQLDAIAVGLEESGWPYVLVIRSNTWCAPKGVGSKGLIVRGFVDQVEVLFHKAIGGFLSHCGWNSMVESLAADVPILAWPFMHDHKLNAKYLVEGLGIGISIQKGDDKDKDKIISPQNISASIRELMIGEKGKKAREKAAELGKLARRAVEDGGSSDANLKILLRELLALRSKP